VRAVRAIRVRLPRPHQQRRCEGEHMHDLIALMMIRWSQKIASRVQPKSTQPEALSPHEIGTRSRTRHARTCGV
jgi:hypothetical protein